MPTTTYVVKKNGTSLHVLAGHTTVRHSNSQPSEAEFVIVQNYATTMPAVGETIEIYLKSGALYFAGRISEIDYQQIYETSSTLSVTVRANGYDDVLFRKTTWNNATSSCSEYHSYSGWVNTSGVDVYYVDGLTIGQTVSGDKFSKNLEKLHRTVVINGVAYLVDHVVSPDHLVLTSSAGAQSGVVYTYTLHTGDVAKDLIDTHVVIDGFAYGAGTTTIQQGVPVNEIVFDPPVSIYDALNQLAKLNDGWYLNCTPAQVIYLGASTMVSAPRDFTDVSGAYKKTIQIKKTVSDVRNVEISQFDLSGAAITPDSITGDGSAKSWFLSKPMGQIVSVVLNGVDITQQVQEYNPNDTTSTADYFYRVRDKAFWQNAATATLSGSDTLDVRYYAVASNLIEYEDDTAIYNRQLSEGGGSGRYEQFIDRTKFANWLDAQTDAENSVNRYKNDLATIDIITQDTGYAVGQTVTFNVANNDFNEPMFIDSVQAVDNGREGVGDFWYTLSLISVSRRINDNDLLRSLFQSNASTFGGGAASAGASTDNTTPFAPNIASATYSIALLAWANVTLAEFDGTITLPASLGTLQEIEVFAVSPSGREYWLCRFTGGFVAGGALNYSGSNSNVRQTTSAQAGWALRFRAYNSDYVPTPTTVDITGITIPAAGVSALAVVEGSRWKDPVSQANRAQVTVNFNVANYPQKVTIWSNSPTYGRINHGWFDVSAGSASIVIGAQGSATVLYPPLADETVRFYVAIGTWDDTVDPTTVPGYQYYDVTIHSPGTPTATTLTGAYINAVVYHQVIGGGYNVGWDYIEIVLPSDPDLWFVRLRVVSGSGTGGAFVAGGVFNANQDGFPGVGVADWATDNDHAAYAERVPGTNKIRIHDNGGWPVPTDANTTLRFFVTATSRKGGPEGTTVQQNTWSSGVGVSTPGTNAYQEFVVDYTKRRISARTLDPATVGSGLKLDSITNNLVIAYGSALADDGSGNITVLTNGPLYNIAGKINLDFTTDFIVTGGKLTQQAVDLNKSYNFGTEFTKSGGFLIVNAIAVNKLLAGNALFLGTTVFAMSGGGQVTINSAGLTLADNNSAPNSTVTIASTGVTVAKGSTNRVEVTASGVGVYGPAGSLTATSGGIVLTNGSGSLTVTTGYILCNRVFVGNPSGTYSDMGVGYVQVSNGSLISELDYNQLKVANVIVVNSSGQVTGTFVGTVNTSNSITTSSSISAFSAFIGVGGMNCSGNLVISGSCSASTFSGTHSGSWSGTFSVTTISASGNISCGSLTVGGFSGATQNLTIKDSGGGFCQVSVNGGAYSATRLDFHGGIYTGQI